MKLAGLSRFSRQSRDAAFINQARFTLHIYPPTMSLDELAEMVMTVREIDASYSDKSSTFELLLQYSLYVYLFHGTLSLHSVAVGAEITVKNFLVGGILSLLPHFAPKMCADC